MSRRAVAFVGSLALAGCAAVFGIPDDVDRAAGDDDAGPAPVGRPDSGPVSDAPADAIFVNHGPCDPGAPFGPAVAVSGITTPEAEATPRLSDDELTIYFDAIRTAQNTTRDLYFATRTAIGEPFAAARRLDISSVAADDDTPAISADQRTIVFERRSVGMAGSQFFTAQRASAGSDFSIAVPVQDSNAQTDPVNPFLRGDASDLWFSAKTTGEDASLLFIIAQAKSMGDGGYETTFGQLSSTEAAFAFPTISADGLTIYYATADAESGGTSSNGSNLDIFRARRDAKSDAFNRGVRVSELSTRDVLDAPGWISPDNCRLYFTRASANGDQDILVASR